MATEPATPEEMVELIERLHERVRRLEASMTMIGAAYRIEETVRLNIQYAQGAMFQPWSRTELARWPTT